MISRDNEFINFTEYWNLVRKRRKLILSVTAISLLLSVVISLCLPVYYMASASVMPPQQDDTGAGIQTKIGLGALTGGLLGSKSQSDLWVGILKSSSVSDSIIERFKLKEVYNTETNDNTRKVLRSMISVSKSKEDIVTVSVEDKNPERAATMANAFIEELDRVNRGAVMNSGQRMRSFVEKRLTETKAELSKTEEALKSFQLINKAVKLDDQSKAIIETISIVKGQLMAKEVELETMFSYATPTNPAVQLLKTEIDSLKVKLKELEQGNNLPDKKDIFIPTDKIPVLSFEYARILRDAKVQETVFELLTQQYEMARIQEAKDSPTVQVLDIAKVPEIKSRPKRKFVVLFLTAAGFFVSVFWIFFQEYVKNNTAETRC